MGGDGHTSGCQEPAAFDPGRHHAKLAVRDEVDEVLDLLFQGRFILVLGLVGVGVLAAGVGVAERHFGSGGRQDGIISYGNGMFNGLWSSERN